MVSGRLGQSAAAAAREAITAATIAAAEKISANRDIEFPQKCRRGIVAWILLAGDSG
jgi:hypothetical protein